jgi:tRNA U34 5-carboxymethylaminomethyl modifying enzyme MnmG/GidA
MYFKFSLRKHPQPEKLSGYYRLVESYRNADHRVCHRTILNVGFMEDLTADQLNKIQKQLTERYGHLQSVFQEQDKPTVNKFVEKLWQRILASKKLDLLQSENLSRVVNIDILRHSNGREIGAEHITYQVWEKLQLTLLLRAVGFTPELAIRR